MTIDLAPRAPAPSPRAIYRVAADTLERLPLSVPLLMARGALAAIFWRSGQTKLANWDLTVSLFAEEYRVPVLPPEVAAYLATTLELACPVLLVLGLGARFAALALLGMTLVIQIFVYPGSWVDHLTWASLLAFILWRGAGAVSLDRGLDRLLAGRGR